MKTCSWIALPFALGFVLPWVACGGSPHAPATGGGQTTGTTTHTGTTSTTTLPLAACDAAEKTNGACYTPPTHTPPTSCQASDGGTPTTDAGDGDGGAFSCSTAIPSPDKCGTCTEGSCCAALTACASVADCLDCATNASTQADCTTAAIADALNDIYDCQVTCCQDVCFPGCNPVDNAGCDTESMEVCDIDPDNGGYTCFQTVDTAGLCEACDENKGPYCGPGLSCLPDGSCGAFCCDDTDCGTGTCDKTRLPDETALGLCVHK